MSHLHGKNIAHRDLKPENLLLKSPQSDHELKVADFGFAAYVNKTGSLQKGRVPKRSTQCGTPNYVAPEILRAEKYGTAVDMWSIGVLTFVLLGGYPPFHDENQAELFRRIKRAQFEFTPDYWDVISSEAKDFISKLLVTDPTQRLAASQAMLHPWILKGEHEFITQHLEDSALVRLKQFNAKRKFKAAARMVIMARRISKTDQRMRSEQPLGVVTSEIVDAMAKSACLLEDAF